MKVSKGWSWTMYGLPCGSCGVRTSEAKTSPSPAEGAVLQWLNKAMPFLNIEIKARCADPDIIRRYLHSCHAEFKGLDEQTDTYFNTYHGRLKLREGNIENNLIFYDRPDQSGPKDSSFTLVKVEDATGLKHTLERSNGIKVVVKKRREIYYIGNVKFHIDDVPGLGSFVEIEAGNILADLTREELKEQCDHYLNEFKIKKEDLIDRSYSDMLLEKLNK
jgi:predicted adenylyl cyclase CyaB